MVGAATVIVAIVKHRCLECSRARPVHSSYRLWNNGALPTGVPLAPVLREGAGKVTRRISQGATARTLARDRGGL
jgi:hypothetical protein